MITQFIPLPSGGVHFTEEIVNEVWISGRHEDLFHINGITKLDLAMYNVALEHIGSGVRLEAEEI